MLRDAHLVGNTMNESEHMTTGRVRVGSRGQGQGRLDAGLFWAGNVLLPYLVATHKSFL